jgi:adenylosuccinate lyase
MSALTPLDGRYAHKNAQIAFLMNEEALMRSRLRVEIRWLQTLLAPNGMSSWRAAFPPTTPLVLARLDNILRAFDSTAARCVKRIESVVKHDVKAVEYFLVEEMRKDEHLRPYVSLVHLGCTSEDINNIAYATMIQHVLKEIVLPDMNAMEGRLKVMAGTTVDAEMLSLTHGQPASPSTMGKELGVFLHRLNSAGRACARVRILGKFNGAVGTHAALDVADPSSDWQAITAQFVSSFNICVNPMTTQIESHDWIAELCHALMRYNAISIGLCRDMWGYIARGYFSQQVLPAEVGSSTMPHRTNPIFFENAEGNFGLANALLSHMAEKLPVSRFQRDLTDSTVLRSVGSALGYTSVAMQSVAEGLDRVMPDTARMSADVTGRYELLAEAVQTALRVHGHPHAYELLKTATRGCGAMTREQMHAVIDKAGLSIDATAELKALTPNSYTGKAKQLAIAAIAAYTPHVAVCPAEGVTECAPRQVFGAFASDDTETASSRNGV